MSPEITFIGGGQMARALAGGMLRGGRPSSIAVIDRNPDAVAWWNEHHPDVVASSDSNIDPNCPTVVLAVKPNAIDDVIQSSPTWEGKLVISIAAGVTLKRLCVGVGHRRVIRVMPNTPALVGAGASAFATAADVGDRDVATLRKILEPTGLVLSVPESAINAVTGLSGSGPAYVCMMIEALADGGVAAGLSRDVAMQLAVATVGGTAELIRRDGRHPGQLKDAVASPGGTTIAAIRTLEKAGLRSALIEAVLAAKDHADRM